MRITRNCGSLFGLGIPLCHQKGHTNAGFGSTMRIISGKFKSRRLKGTPPPGVRPTSDKLRVTLFNVLGSRVDGAIFLDGCAGAGAVGIEAICWGAGLGVLIELFRSAGLVV